MPEKIRIRPAGAADAEVFLSLVDALADYETLDRPTPEARERLVRDGFGEARRFQPYLAERNGRVVAYAITFETYSSFLALPTLYLEDIFVLPEARRAGIGERFFRFLAGEAVRRGCGRMEWVVLDWNEPAIRFYEKIGGQRLREWMTYRLTADRLAAIADGSPAADPAAADV
jgi:GNAT superfamily N-acetyltransferase